VWAPIGNGHHITSLDRSPTDDKWDWVKEQPLLAENVALAAWIKKKEAERRAKARMHIVAPPPLATEIKELGDDVTRPKDEPFDPRIPESCFFVEYSENDLRDIVAQQKRVITLLKKHGESKYLANRILFIFDDLVGSNLFTLHRDNPFKMLNTNMRHLNASILMVSQVLFY